MDTKARMEIVRNILNNAIEMNMGKGIVFRISKKMDKYIVKYYYECGDSRSSENGVEEENNL
jgi:hypothetical protein